MALFWAAAFYSTIAYVLAAVYGFMLAVIISPEEFFDS